MLVGADTASFPIHLEENASDGEIVLSIDKDQIQSCLKMTFDGGWNTGIISEVPPARRTETSSN